MPFRIGSFLTSFVQAKRYFVLVFFFLHQKKELSVSEMHECYACSTFEAGEVGRGHQGGARCTGGAPAGPVCPSGMS